jgi:hypothetical protein
MLATQVRTLDAGRRVQVFLDTEAAAIGKAVPPTLRAMLDDAVTQLAAFQLQQGTAEGTAKGETANQVVLREDVYTRFMAPIGATAKIELKSTPEFPNLVVPALARRKIDFLAIANKFADAAAKHEALLVQHGISTDFLTQLHAALATTAASADARDRSLGLKKAATEGCVTAAKAVRDRIGQLDRTLKAAFPKKTPLLADFQASKRIRQVPVTPLPTGNTVVTPAPTPTVQPTTTPPVVPPAA